MPSSTTYTITSPSAEANGGGSDLTSGSSCVVEPYQTVGPADNHMVMVLVLVIMAEQ